MSGQIRWGILGTGSIARTFARALQQLPGAATAAVGSRAPGTADGFAQEFKFTRAHGSYRALAEDPEVDVIYIATPHALHCENALMCLEAGKAVLCEKPFMLNAHEARRVVAKAREKHLFLMEAMWTRFFPAMAQARAWIAAGEIGDPRMLHADFGFRADDAEAGSLLDPSLGGGSLLDVGVYPIALAHDIFRRAPAEIQSVAHLGEQGVDEQAAMVFRYDKGAIASLSCAVVTETPQSAAIMGTKGRIDFGAPFWKAETVTLRVGEADPVVKHFPTAGNGYEYEAQAVMDCIREKKLEHPLMTWHETIEIMQTMDKIRAQWNMHFPGENKS